MSLSRISKEKKTEQKFKEMEDFWQDTQTKTSSRDSCRNAFKDFINNYELIYEFNKPVLKYFDKSYKQDFIDNFRLNKVYEDYLNLTAKKINVHFRIYPLFEYFALLKVPTKDNKDDKQEKEPEPANDKKNPKKEKKNDPEPSDEKKNPKKDKNIQNPDYSIFLRILKQLVMILKYNVTKKTNNPKKYAHNIQIYPILLDNYCPEFEELQKLMVDKMNVMVVELLEVPEVFCFVIPKDAIDDNQKTLGPKIGEVQSFNQMIHALEKMYQYPKDLPSKLADFYNENVPIEIKELLIDLVDCSNMEKIHWEDFIMNCFFIEQTFELKEKGIKWKVDREFLLEYYLLVQINRMCAVIAKQVKIDLPDKGSYFEEMLKNHKVIKSLLPEVNKENKEKVQEFFAKNNMTYLYLLKWIGEKDFMKDLLLFKSNIIKNINPKNLHDDLTPLQLFYLFLNDIQVFY